MLRGHYWSHSWGPLQDIAPTKRLWVGDWNKCIFHLTQDWICLGRGHYSSWIFKNGGRGAKYGHYSSRSLGHYLHQAWALGQIWHWSKSLSNVAEYCYQICLKPARRSKFHCVSFCVYRQDDQRYSNVCNVKKYLSSLWGFTSPVICRISMFWLSGGPYTPFLPKIVVG